MVGQLTHVGQEQSYQLGKHLHQEYILKHGLIQPTYTENEVRWVHYGVLYVMCMCVEYVLFFTFSVIFLSGIKNVIKKFLCLCSK